MILDSGICKIYKINDISETGEMPKKNLILESKSWYGELDFSSSPIQHTDVSEMIEISQRIRIIQNRMIMKNKTIVIIGADQFNVERIFHGKDEETGELISDISLSQVVELYDTK